MFVSWSYWMWTSGNFTVTQTIGLDPARRYLATGALTGKEGASYGQVYISMLCTQRSSDQILCGIRDDPADPLFTNISTLGVAEFIQNATRVTIKLRGDGGLHRAEGVIYDIT
jgi:hypothetical protein